MKNKTTREVETIPNPSGKGGFADHPENRSPGGWKKETKQTYWLNYFFNMPVSEFLEWPKITKKEDRMVAAELAYVRVCAARKDLKNYEAVINRTEGMPRQSVDMNATGKISFDVENLDNLFKSVYESIITGNSGKDGTNGQDGGAAETR